VTVAQIPLTRVVIVTGNGDRANAVKAVQLGAFDFHLKPKARHPREGLSVEAGGSAGNRRLSFTHASPPVAVASTSGGYVGRVATLARPLSEQPCGGCCVACRVLRDRGPMRVLPGAVDFTGPGAGRIE
jgi:hypothetical protein